MSGKTRRTSQGAGSSRFFILLDGFFRSIKKVGVPILGPDLIVPILFIVILLAFSAFFSASETALNTVSSVRLKNKAKEGDRLAGKTLGLIEDYDRTLSTILVGNNL